MILDPLPRFVLPTAEPLFSLPRRWRRSLLRSNPTFHGVPDLRPIPAIPPRNGRPVAISENAGGRFDKEDSDRVSLSTALPCARSITPRSKPAVHRVVAVPF